MTTPTYNQTSTLFLGTPIVTPGQKLGIAPLSSLLASPTITDGLNRGVSGSNLIAYDWYMASGYYPSQHSGGLSVVISAVVASGNLICPAQITFYEPGAVYKGSGSAVINPPYVPTYTYNLLNNGNPVPYVLWNDSTGVDSNGNLLQWVEISPEQMLANTNDANPSNPLAYVGFTKFLLDNNNTDAYISSVSTIGSRYGNSSNGAYSCNYIASLNLSTTSANAGQAGIQPSYASVTMTGNVPSYVPTNQQSTYSITLTQTAPVYSSGAVYPYFLEGEYYALNDGTLYTYNTNTDTIPGSNNYAQEYLSCISSTAPPT